jgi:peptidoglycan/LPS O-acetylase OafA/YrhL
MTDHPASTRRYDLDWLRIAAFALLILYHIGMLYVAWPWHVKSIRPVPAIEPLMLLSSPWRLTLLFLISGVAARHLLDRQRPGAFARDRLRRLLPPLLFAMLVVVPPQSYWEVVTRLGYQGDYWSFWARYLAFDRGFGLILPTWNHLWFVTYLLAYVLLAALARRFTGGSLPEWPWRGWPLILLPAGLFALYRATLYPVFGETHAFGDDPYAHAHYGTAFLIGFAIARRAAAWATLTAWRWPLLAAVLYLALASHGGGQPARAVAREFYAWLLIATLLGFGRRHLDHDHPARRYLTEAVFPYYILHQTLIILIWAGLRPFALGPAAEAAAIAAGTVTGCALGFELIRRVPALRFLFGVKPLPAP